jgi:short-chain fatty acids transporter
VSHTWPDRVADARTLPVYTFLSACLLNMFIPSGGGQWAVQGPVALESGLALGVPPGKMVMAVAYGDQITNMLQVFWALPLLAITGARARDIVGYTSLVMLVGMAWTIFALLAF